MPYTWSSLLNAAYGAQSSAYTVTATRAYTGTWTKNTYAAWGDASSGGAILDLNYTNGVGDPASHHWLQLTHANYTTAAEAGKTFHVEGEPADVVWAIDNSPDYSNPFYDQGEPGLSPSHFSDNPSTGWDGKSWFDGYLFLASDLGSNHLEISEAPLYWGFVDPILAAVPEPGTTALILLGVIAAGVYRFRTCVKQFVLLRVRGRRVSL